MQASAVFVKIWKILTFFLIHLKPKAYHGKTGVAKKKQKETKNEAINYNNLCRFCFLFCSFRNSSPSGSRVSGNLIKRLPYELVERNE